MRRSPAAMPGDAADSLKGYGQQIVQGVELGVAGKVTEAWKVFGGLALIRERAQAQRLPRRGAVAPATATAGDYGAVYTSTSGDELAFTPNVTGNLWTTYRFPFGLTLGGGVQYVGIVLIWAVRTTPIGSSPTEGSASCRATSWSTRWRPTK